jgi:hypothetical protein
VLLQMAPDMWYLELSNISNSYIVLVWATNASFWHEQISRCFICTIYVLPFIQLLFNLFCGFVKNVHLMISWNNLFAHEYIEPCTFG